MKPGDLVRLSSDYSDRGVCVAGIHTRARWWFAEGTLAVFLGAHNAVEFGHEQKLKILVEGQIGWIYETECAEVISEAG